MHVSVGDTQCMPATAAYNSVEGAASVCVLCLQVLANSATVNDVPMFTQNFTMVRKRICLCTRSIP